MRTSLTALAVVVVALAIGCSQPSSPVSPSSVPSGDASITPTDGSATSAAAPAAAAKAAEKKVPFKGRLEGIGTITPLTPPLASVLIEANGNATQLGGFTVQVPHIVNQTAMTGSGSYQFIAANGDTLTATFNGQATPTSPGVLSILETATITGGTGRFAGATGSFTATRVFNLATSVTTGSFEGTISSPGVSKR